MSSAPLRIVHLTTYVFPDKFGGAERVVHGIAKAQAALGHRVTVLSGNHDARPAFEQLDGFDLVRYPLASGRRGIAFFAEVDRAAKKALADPLLACDVLHAHQPASALAASAARTRLRVYSFYAPWSAEREVEQAGGSLLRRSLEALRTRLVRRLDARILRAPDRLVALSEFSRTQIAELAPRRAKEAAIVPPGVDARFHPGNRDVARRHLGLTPSGPLLISVRRLMKRMGLDDLLEALARVRTTGRPPELAIAGDGPERPTLEARAAALGLGSRVRFLGRVPEEHLPDLYRAADLFVLPTRALEGFGMATLEALASGVPLLATNIGATPELLRRAGMESFAVAPGGEALAQGIERFLADTGSWRAAAASASEVVRRELSWEACARSLVALYHARLPA